MPTYNRASVLRDTIQQVLDQTFKDYELIIYNDGSSDSTVEIIREINDTRIIFLNNENAGPPHPLNGILSIAKGEYIIILHDHDFFHPQLLEKSLAILEKFPDVGFVLQGSAWIDEDGVSNYKEMLLNFPEINSGRDMAFKMLTNKKGFDSFFHACCMVRRTALIKAGWYYDIKFSLYADTDLWYRLLLVTNFAYINEVLFKFRTREVSGHFLSNKEFEILSWNRDIQELNLNRYFGDSTEKKHFLEQVQKKWQKYIKIATIKFGSNNFDNLFLKGLYVIKEFETNKVLKICVSILIKLKFFRNFVVIILSAFNKSRKWVKVN